MFAERWRTTQGDFVDQPEMAVRQADLLVAEVMGRRGYPVGDFEQMSRDVSVDHAEHRPGVPRRPRDLRAQRPQAGVDRAAAAGDGPLPGAVHRPALRRRRRPRPVRAPTSARDGVAEGDGDATACHGTGDRVHDDRMRRRPGARRPVARRPGAATTGCATTGSTTTACSDDRMRDDRTRRTRTAGPGHGRATPGYATDEDQRFAPGRHRRRADGVRVERGGRRPRAAASTAGGATRTAATSRATSARAPDALRATPADRPAPTTEAGPRRVRPRRPGARVAVTCRDGDVAVTRATVGSRSAACGVAPVPRTPAPAIGSGS